MPYIDGLERGRARFSHSLSFSRLAELFGSPGRLLPTFWTAGPRTRRRSPHFSCAPQDKYSMTALHELARTCHLLGDLTTEDERAGAFLPRICEAAKSLLKARASKA